MCLTRNYSSLTSSEFLKFSPLPPKNTRRTGLYTGPHRWPATDSYYRKWLPLSNRKGVSHKWKATEGDISPRSVNPGEIVEVLARDGSFKGFGMVTFSLSNNQFDFIDLNGDMQQANVSEVSFLLRGVFPQLPFKKYDLEDTVQTLRGIVAKSLSQIHDILPHLAVIHAQLVMKDRPRAVDFQKVCKGVNALSNPFDGSSVTKIQILAVYLAVAYHSLCFVRLHRSPFVAVSAKSMDAVNKIMNSLTRVELDHGSAQLMDGKRTGLAKTLRDFLNHWALWNDSRISRAAEAVLENCEGGSRILDSPRALSSALSKVGNIDLFPWLSDTNQPIQSNGNNEATGTHLFTSNFLQKCILLDKSTAIRVDTNRNKLHIFVPYLPNPPTILSPTSRIGVRARSVKLRNTIYPLLEMGIVDKYAFKLDKTVSAVHLSVCYNPNTYEWDNSSVRVDVSEIVPITEELDKNTADVLSSVDPLISDHELQLPTQLPAASTNGNEANDPLPLKLIHAEAAAGRMAGIYMNANRLEAPFLATVRGYESVYDKAARHERLNADAYVPISRPFDSSLSLLAQRQLLAKPISPVLYNGRPRQRLASKLQESILPQLQLLSQLELRDFQYWTLRNLQEQLQASATFHIFRCILLESSNENIHPQGELLKGFCLDLGINVDVFVPPHTERIYNGDQIIGTEILELDPLQGLFVVSM